MCDCDGWTSAAIFINYLHSIDENFAASNITYYQHKGKEHGLKDIINEILEDSPDLVVCPDSASNDIEEQDKLYKADMHCLILDHHECDKVTGEEKSIIINPQLCDYPNKNLTGAGVTWMFCRAFDEIKGYDFANKFIDLAFLGDCGDMASYKEKEIRALTNLGIETLNNPFFYAMARKNDYSIQKMGGLNYYSVAFYVVPFINSLVRSGTEEEKELVFDSFLLKEAFSSVPSSKRGHKGEFVKLYDEAVLTAERVKRRQTKLQDEAMEFLEKQIAENHLADNSIIVCLCEPGQVEKNLQGLVANKLMAKYQKPCLVLTRSRTKDDGQDYYRGSARNYGYSELKDLRQLCLDSGLVEYAQGHSAAFGVSLPENRIEEFVQQTNETLKDMNSEPVYLVDYIWRTKNEIDGEKILDIANLNIYGQEIPESYVALERVPITPNMVTLMGVEKGNPTLKIQIGNVALIKFKSSAEEFEEFQQEDLVLSAVCKCNKNEWAGNVNPQLLVEDFELDTEWIF